MFQHRPGRLIDLVKTSAKCTFSDWLGPWLILRVATSQVLTSSRLRWPCGGVTSRGRRAERWVDTVATSDRTARVRLSCAVDGGDPAVAELMQKLGRGRPRSSRGALGEPPAQRAARVRVEVFERLATAASARFIIPGDEEWPARLLICGTPRAFSAAVASRSVCGSAAPAISLASWNGQSQSWAQGQQRRMGPASRQIWPEHRSSYLSRYGSSLLDATCRGQPFRTVLRDLELRPNQVWGLTKTDQE